MDSEREAVLDNRWPCVKVGTTCLLMGAIAGICAGSWRQKPVSVTNIVYTNTTDSHDWHIHVPLPSWQWQWPLGGSRTVSVQHLTALCFRLLSMTLSVCSAHDIRSSWLYRAPQCE